MLLPNLLLSANEQASTLDLETLMFNLRILMNATGQAVWFWGNILIVACETRITASMFLQLNPYYEPFASLWTFTDPVFNLGRLYYPKVLGFDICPFVNMGILQKMTNELDKRIFGENEMNSEDILGAIEAEVLEDRRYALTKKLLAEIKPETEKEWLESFSFEDIYYHKVPGAPPLDGNGVPIIKIDTLLPVIDEPAPVSEFGISLTHGPLNFLYNIIVEVIHIPVNLLHLLTGN